MSGRYCLLYDVVLPVRQILWWRFFVGLARQRRVGRSAAASWRFSDFRTVLLFSSCSRTLDVR